MSTRSIIMIVGKGNYNDERSVRIYRHSDGYPSSVLPLIAVVLSKANEQCEADNRRYNSGKPRVPIVEQVVGLLIGASTDTYGMSVRIDEGEDGKPAIYFEKFKVKHLGNQYDLEWVYVVDLNSDSVKVYGGGYSGESPQHTYRKGLVDPLSYADQLKKEFQEQERQEIKKAIALIKGTGFTLNPKRKRSAKKDIFRTEGLGEIAAVFPLKAAA